MIKTMVFACAASALLAGAASAATISGSWTVTAVNVVGTDKENSKATYANLENAFNNAVNGVTGHSYDVFGYQGKLSFGTFDGSDSTTISDWLGTGEMGTVDGLDADFGALQLSKPDIINGDATTTFFYFYDDGFESGPLDDDDFQQLAFAASAPLSQSPNIGALPSCEADSGGSYSAGTLSITHDDGMFVCGAGGFAGPNSKRTTVLDYGGGYFDMIYVATNGDPSILNVDLEPVPLPAGLPLLLAGLGGFALLRRRQI